MNSKLKEYFPIIQTKAEILAEIHSKEYLNQQFQSWTTEQQEEFLDFCTGVKGVKILYDAFFKEIMNPETAPEYLEEFLSLLLNKQTKIFCVLPNDSVRITDESSLLITDIVVQLEDGSLANVEIQRIGYLFPGARSACYSADLLLRQYKRVRGEKSKKFSYKNIKNVYTIVLFEKSPKEFRAFSDCYCHYFEQTSSSGLELDLLQKYIFIPLDIFQKRKHNKNITDKLDAWLMFFSSDDPEDIIRLMEAYPVFKPLYETVYHICRNMERIMGIFSEELLELDRNTAQYMIDEMQDMIDQHVQTIDEQGQIISRQEQTINQQGETIGQQALMIQQQAETIKRLQAQLKEK